MAGQQDWIQRIIPSSSVSRGIVSGLMAVLLTTVLELTSLNHVRRLLDGKGGPELYLSALRTNLRNNFILGPVTYHFTITYICSHDQVPHAPLRRLGAVAGIVVTEGILYYYIHKCFHEIKGLYWMHRYHHKFNATVLPSSANAVSVAEYIFAYMIPIVLGVCLTSADELSAFSAAAVIAITNLLIHTPGLEESTSRHYHWLFVSTSDHLSHHRKNQKGNYGAPVLHLDRICAYASK